MSQILLFYIFFRVGLFTVGGGLASLGLLHEYLVEPGYITSDAFYNMFAISQSTPGPIGINMATYIGFEYYGVWGAMITTFALVLPSFVIITTIALTLKNFDKNKFVKSAFSGFRPAAVGIILSVGYMLLTGSVLQINDNFVFDSTAIIKCCIFGIGFIASLKFKLHPLLVVLFGGIVGAIWL